jgi:Flp pilus assembly protein TadD
MISDNSMAFYQHINAAVDFGNGDIQVVDLSVENYDYNYPQTPISDDRAAAQHYNNRAIEQLNKDDTAGAYRYLRRALYLSPDASHIWGNLGTVFRRDGHLANAETAYRQALFLNDKDQVAISNLARLYQETGKHDQAEILERRALSFQRTNPFWHFGRARQEYEVGDFEGALSAINRAIAIDDQQYRFFEFQALIHKRLGDLNASRRSARQAARIKLAD